MSAHRDRSQPVKFQFSVVTAASAGPAQTESLKAEEQAPASAPELHALLDQIDAHLGHIQKSRTEIAFLVADLKRLIV